MFQILNHGSIKLLLTNYITHCSLNLIRLERLYLHYNQIKYFGGQRFMMEGYFEQNELLEIRVKHNCVRSLSAIPFLSNTIPYDFT
jgi:hypothetical protein